MNTYNPLYQNKQLPFEYFAVYLHHIDSVGPRLLMHTPIWIEPAFIQETFGVLNAKPEVSFDQI